jgi:hypothetical protein
VTLGGHNNDASIARDVRNELEVTKDNWVVCRAMRRA